MGSYERIFCNKSWFVKLFKHHRLCSIKLRSIEGKLKFNRAVWFFRCKFEFVSYFFSGSIKNRPCQLIVFRLVHEHAQKFIFLSRCQVLIFNRIYYGSYSFRIWHVLTAFLVKCGSSYFVWLILKHYPHGVLESEGILYGCSIAFRCLYLFERVACTFRKALETSEAVPGTGCILRLLFCRFVFICFVSFRIHNNRCVFIVSRFFLFLVRYRGRRCYLRLRRIDVWVFRFPYDVYSGVFKVIFHDFEDGNLAAVFKKHELTSVKEHLWVLVNLCKVKLWLRDIFYFNLDRLLFFSRYGKLLCRKTVNHYPAFRSLVASQIETCLCYGICSCVQVSEIKYAVFVCGSCKVYLFSIEVSCSLESEFNSCNVSVFACFHYAYRRPLRNVIKGKDKGCRSVLYFQRLLLRLAISCLLLIGHHFFNGELSVGDAFFNSFDILAVYNMETYSRVVCRENWIIVTCKLSVFNFPVNSGCSMPGKAVVCCLIPSSTFRFSFRNILNLAVERSLVSWVISIFRIINIFNVSQLNRNLYLYIHIRSVDNIKLVVIIKKTLDVFDCDVLIKDHLFWIAFHDMLKRKVILCVAYCHKVAASVYDHSSGRNRSLWIYINLRLRIYGVNYLGRSLCSACLVAEFVCKSYLYRLWRFFFCQVSFLCFLVKSRKVLFVYLPLTKAVCILIIIRKLWRRLIKKLFRCHYAFVIEDTCYLEFKSVKRTVVSNCLCNRESSVSYKLVLTVKGVGVSRLKKCWCLHSRHVLEVFSFIRWKILFALICALYNIKLRFTCFRIRCNLVLNCGIFHIG